MDIDGAETKVLICTVGGGWTKGPPSWLSSIKGLPRCAAVRNPPADAGGTREVGSIPESGTSLRRGNVNPLE